MRVRVRAGAWDRPPLRASATGSAVRVSAAEAVCPTLPPRTAGAGIYERQPKSHLSLSSVSPQSHACNHVRQPNGYQTNIADRDTAELCETIWLTRERLKCDQVTCDRLTDV